MACCGSLYFSITVFALLMVTHGYVPNDSNNSTALVRKSRNVIVDYLLNRWQQSSSMGYEKNNGGEASQGRKATSDPVTSYYDFIINEGSYKFWAWFQVATAALLIYSAFAAVYYAKYTFATTDYSDYEDDFFFKRSGAAYAPDRTPQQSSFLGLSPATFQRIMDAVSSKKYS